MTDTNVIKLAQPGTFTDSLTEILRNGARALLTQAVETEVADFLGRYADLKTEAGHQRVVRHGHLPEREIMTGIGSVAVRQPRVRDREAVGGERIRFSPTILPPYARRTKSLEVLIPILYLKGISTGDFEEALGALLGKDAGGLSASTIARLKEAWVDEHARWRDRDLSAKRYVYVWADGIYVQARLEDDAQCLLVIIGATRRRQEGTGWACRRHPRERAILEGAAARSQAARSDDRPATCRRRRGARLLEGDRRGVAEDTSATLLGAQNRECLEQAAKEPAGQGQARIAGHLDGGDQEGRRDCARCVHRNLRHQVREGRRVPDERPRRAASPSTTSPPSTGNIYARQTRSRARSRPSGIERSDQEVASQTRPRSP